MSIKSIIFILISQLPTSVLAATFCVQDATELRTALSIAGSNNSFDTIRVSTGLYQTNGTAFSYYDENGLGLDISGGWSQVTSAPCSAQLGQGLYHTVLDGDATSAVMDILLTDSASIHISQLTFINGLSSDVAGLEISKYEPDNIFTGTYTLEHNVFANNEGVSTSALEVTGFERLDIRNNLFVDNHSDFETVLRIGENLGAEMVLNNNTLVNNLGAIKVSLYGSSQLLLANNTMRSLYAYDLVVFGGEDWYLYNNNIGRYLSSEEPLAQFKNYKLPNRFAPGTNNYTPAADSPLIDAGRTPCALFCPFPLPFTNDWQLGNYALEGQLREQGNAPDTGAFESAHTQDIIFMQVFD